METQPLVRLGKRLAELRDDPVGVGGRVGHLDQDLDLVAYPVRRVEMDLELVDLVVFADDGLDRTGVDVRPSYETHVVDPAADPTVVDVERPAA